MNDILLISEMRLRTILNEAVTQLKDGLVTHETETRDWLTNEEAQTYFSVSRPTLQRYQSSGKLPYSKVGARVYFRRANLDALLERHLR